ncbi:MAG: hypothetical protein WBB43_19255 [Limnoraphis sp.]
MGVAELGREMQMKNWEFLLQKEGDTTWLPLETPDVEILEGRYRVVARSSYPNAKIEIRIVHHALEETPPVRRVQTRNTNTSAEGLMVVIPYTRLKPGIWELSCSPHRSAALVNLSSDNGVKLRVLSNDSEPLEHLPTFDDDLSSDSDEAVLDENDYEDDSQTTVTAKSIVEIVDERNTTPETQPPETQPEYTSIESIDDTDSTPNFEREPSDESSDTDFAIAAEPSPEPSEAVLLESDDPLCVEVDDIQLTLEQDSFVAKLGQALLISGRVEAATSSEPLNPEPTQYSIDQPHVEVYLRDPHNSNILLQVQQAIPQSILPISFACLIYIPFECQTRLILGEVVISSHGDQLTRHSFSVATQVEHLLQALETDFSSPAEIDETTDEPDEVELENRLHLIDPNASPEPEPSVSKPNSRRPTVPVVPANSQTSIDETTSSSSLELPSFGYFLSGNSEQSVDSTASSSEKTPTTSPETADAEILTPTDETSPEIISSETDDEESEEVQLVPVSPIDPAFQALRLENRFWSRLNSLAHDQDLSQWMKQAKPTPLPDTSFVQTRPDESPKPSVSSPSAEAEPLFPSFDDDLESQEIVVDDESLETPPSSVASRPPLRVLDSRQSQSSMSESFSAISEDEPIPAPMLEVINPEIIAGRTVKVRVRMSENLPRIYVKIWVYDRQSRSIVDGPRWLTEFSPNGLDQIETTVNLEIAYGSLEVQFEAIAVEMQTQRESHKVIVERSVVPPAAPTLPLDEE